MSRLFSNFRLCSRLVTQNGLFRQSPTKIGHQIPLRRGYPAITAFEGGEGKTTVTILNMEEYAPLMINSYSEMGFRLNNGVIVVGPIVIFSKTVLCWNIAGAEEISVDSLSMFSVIEPRIDILVVGVGGSTEGMDMSWMLDLKRKGINLEVLPTEKACSTFNFLSVEKRSVAAALIPPLHIQFTDQDLLDTLDRKNILFKDIPSVADDTPPSLLPPGTKISGPK